MMVYYYIKCVNEDGDGNIASVGYGNDLDDKINKDLKPKEEVISDIDEEGRLVKTAYYSDQKREWVTGDEVHTVEGEYIRTDGNDIESDNLGELQSCPS